MARLVQSMAFALSTLVLLALPAASLTLPPNADTGQPVIPNIRDPSAVNAQSKCPGYKASNVVQNSIGFSATLTLAGKACNVYGTDIEKLSLTVQYQSSDRLSINISPSVVDSSNISHYILPEQLVPRPSPAPDAQSQMGKSDLKLSWSNDPTFNFAVTRASTNDVLFSTKGSVIVYENQFIEFVTQMPENYNLYGLSEHIHGLRLGNDYTATFWNLDAGDPIDANIYGTHPFYLDTRYFQIGANGKKTLVTASEADKNGKYISYSHGVFLRNAHGQEVLLREKTVTWRTLGGSIDLFFFDGPTQPEVTKQYQLSAVGLPAMQQYFTFGYHQCRWGYSSWTVVKNVVDTFKKSNIPLETIWTDIDYMNQYRAFTTDPKAFSVPDGQKFLAELHANGQHYVPIVDSGIYVPNPSNAADAYPTFNRGNDSKVFILNPDRSLYVGAVWPGYTVFPDWHAPKAVEWWSNELVNWHKQIPFDGIWIDMSEASSFCIGSCGSKSVRSNPVLPRLPGNDQAAAVSARMESLDAKTTSYLRTTPVPGVRNVNWPPYAINHYWGDIATHGISPNATHHDGVQEYDVHNLFGYQILNATYQGLRATFQGKRPFIIGRSTFAGSGKWAGHWGGDNTSAWIYMFFSIPQALSFSLSGIPMFGVDTCGFLGNTSEELCNRWMQLSAFFPFYRNHNVIGAVVQEPYNWASVAEASRVAMNIRYQLLPYIYTLFYQAHTTGSTVMRALSWEFPNEPLLAAADRQFLLGPSIMVTPVLQQGAKTVNGVFPNVGNGEIWYDWYQHTKVTAAPGQNLTIQAPLGHIPVYVRGGSILPTQKPGYTTAQSRKNPWSLIIALDKGASASGQLYLDDGESVVPDKTLTVNFKLSQGKLSSQSTGTFVDSNALSNITIMGVASYKGHATLNNISIASQASFNSAANVLSFTGLDKYTSKGAWSQNWQLTWV